MPHAHKSKSKSARADGGCVHCCVAGCGPAKERDSRRVHPKHPEIVKRVDRGGGESVALQPPPPELAKAAIQQQEAKNGSREGEKGASFRR